MFSSKKGIELTITLIITVSVGLLVLGIYFFFIKSSVGMYDEETSCEGFGHVLSNSCSEQFSIRNGLIQEDKNGLICCMPKPGFADQFKEWKSDNKLEETEIQEQEQIPELEKTSFEASTSTQSYLFSVQEIPDYTSTGIAKKIETTDTKQGNSYFKINDVFLFSEQIAIIYPGIASIEAKNNHQDTQTCILQLQEENEDGSLKAPLSQHQYVLSPCKKQVWMGFTPIIEHPDTMYKLVFIGKQGNEELFRDYAFISTNNLDQPDDSNELKSRTIHIKQTENIVFRENKIHAFVYPVVDYGSRDDINIWVYLEEKGNDCSSSHLLERKYGSFTKISLSSNQQACVVYDAFENEEFLATTSEVKMISGVDTLVILDGFSYETYFESCPLTCEEYDKTRCSEFATRQDVCQYSLNCFWSEKDETHTNNFCASCETISSCSDLSTKIACENNQCILRICEWDNQGLFKKGICKEKIS